MSRYRNWVFTVNNPERLLVPDQWADCSYCVYQEEIGETGTYHLQGYVEFSVRKRLGAVKLLVGLERAHLERRRGSAKQASDYAQKEDTRIGGPYVFGAMKKQGERADLSAAKESIDEGMDMTDFAQDHFSCFIRYGNAFKEYKRLIVPKRDWIMDVQVYTGPTGTGKTVKAYHDYPGLYNVPCAKTSGTYWDDYDGQETVLVDEMYGNRFAWGFLLQLLDSKPMKVPIHGGCVEFTSRRIIFTSNAHPGLWYKSPSYLWNASNPLKRRISTHLEFPLDNPAPLAREENLRLLGNPIVLAQSTDLAIALALSRDEMSE